MILKILTPRNSRPVGIAIIPEMNSRIAMTVTPVGLFGAGVGNPGGTGNPGGAGA
jgi:hypothetical protein